MRLIFQGSLYLVYLVLVSTTWIAYMLTLTGRSEWVGISAYMRLTCERMLYTVGTPIFVNTLYTIDADTY